MKVLVIPEYDLSGGTFTFLTRLLAVHAKRGIETAVLIEERQLFPAVLALYERYRVRVFLGRFVKDSFAPFADLASCREACRVFRPDLIVVSNGKPGILTGVLFYPLPVVFFMHTYPGRDRLPLRGRLLLSVATRLRNRIVTVSAFSARRISAYFGIPLKRIAVVYNACTPVTQERATNPSTMILTIGHVSTYKNPQLWLQVAAQVVARRPAARFVWLGGGELLESMREAVRSAGLDASVEFHGYCDDVQRFYREALLYFQPSLMESHGIAVVEAMAHGLACVVSDAGGLSESVVNGETGLLSPPDNEAAFAAKIIGLLDDGVLREKLGAAGQQHAEKLFSPERQEEKIVGLYQALLKEVDAG